MKQMIHNIQMFIWMILLTGLLYPLLITGIAQLTMKQKADGDFISLKGKKVGAVLIAQKFESERYFWPRPSTNDYNPLPSGGSNLGFISTELKKRVEERKKKILNANGNQGTAPAELLFASGSGLDPHITPSTAYFQSERIAKARGIKKEQVKNLIDKMTLKASLRFIGESRVNVLMLNIALDELAQASSKTS